MMPRYIVYAEQCVWDELRYEVEADSADAARQRVLDRLEEPYMTRYSHGARQPMKIVNVEEVQ